MTDYSCVHRGPMLRTNTDASRIGYSIFACERLRECTIQDHGHPGLPVCLGCGLRRPDGQHVGGDDAGVPRVAGKLPAVIQRDFLFSRTGEPANQMANSFAGEPCLLICGGPSLESIDLTPLSQRGILLAAVNNAATVVRPHLWFSVDQQCHFQEGIWRDPAIVKFACRDFTHGHLATRRQGRWVFSDTKACECPQAYFYDRGFGFDPDTFLSVMPPTWGGVKAFEGGRKRVCKSVMLIALRMLYWLGVRTVYLVGCDFKMQAGRSYGFDERKAEGGAATNNRGYQILAEWFEQLRPRFDAAGYRVYNCNPDSELRAYEFRSLDDAIADCTSVIPRHITTRGQYGFA